LREPPRFTSRHPFGVFPQLRADPLAFLTAAARRHGDVVGFRIGPLRSVLLRHPDAIKHVLVDNNPNYDKHTRGYDVLREFLGNGLLTAEGDLWRRQRRIAQPAFHRRRIEGFADAMLADTLDMLRRWDDLAGLGRTVDMAHEMMALTLRIVGRTLLSTDVQDAADEVGHAVTVLHDWADARLDSLLPLELPTPRTLRARAASRRLDRIIGDLITRRRGGEHAEDLLGMLMEAKDAETGESMTDRQLRDEVTTMFLAGHETTANALAWTFYLLSTHPEVERRLRAELDAALAGVTPVLADLPRLPYLLQVVKESMRLYPPAWILDRRAKDEDSILGYRVRKNTLVLCSPYVTHRHPELWPNPEGFDPERFTAAAEATRPRYAYFPFGGGPRQCIGIAFAMMEAQLILATVLQRYRPWLIPGQSISAEPLITLRPRAGLHMGLTPIRAAAAAAAQ